MKSFNSFFNVVVLFLPYLLIVVVVVFVVKKIKDYFAKGDGNDNGGSQVGKTEFGDTIDDVENSHPVEGVVVGKTSTGKVIVEAGPRITEERALDVANAIGHCIYDSFWHEDDRGIFDALYNAPIKCVSDWNLIVQKYAIREGKLGKAYDLPNALKEYLDSNYYSELNRIYFDHVNGWKGFV